MIAENRTITRWRHQPVADEDGAITRVSEWVAREATLTVIVNGEELVRLSSSPTHCIDLALGFLLSEGVIARLSDVDRIDRDAVGGTVAFTLTSNRPFNAPEWWKRRTLTSGCGEGVTHVHDLPRISRDDSANGFHLLPEYFGRLFAILRQDYSLWYERTGCIHQAALASNGGPTLLRDDIGRHNAVDKVIGAGLRGGLPFSSTILCCTGRLSSDMIRKAAHAGIPVVASRAAPTSLAVDLAEETGMTLVGFVRGRRINVYSHPERILLDRTAE